jgi:hypothetical protein
MKARSDKLGYMHKEQFEKTKATLQNNPFPNANQEFMSKDEQKKIEKEGDWMQLEALLKRDS